MEREVLQVKSEVVLARKEVNPVRQHVDLATYGGHRCRGRDEPLAAGKRPHYLRASRRKFSGLRDDVAASSPALRSWRLHLAPRLDRARPAPHALGANPSILAPHPLMRDGGLVMQEEFQRSLPTNVQ